MPFLYLPDALSLILLLLVLTLLRSSASMHLQQELRRLRMDLLERGCNSDIRSVAPAYTHLTRQVGSAIESAGRMSPALLLPVERTVRRVPEGSCDHLLPEWMFGFESLLHLISDSKIREKLGRVQMELNMNLGMFYMFASISGWMFTIGILIRLVRRAFMHRSKDRIDWLFDMMEKIFIRQGRRAHRLALLAGIA